MGGSDRKASFFLKKNFKSESGGGEGSFNLNVTIHGVGGNLAKGLEMGRVRILSGRGKLYK